MLCWVMKLAEKIKERTGNMQRDCATHDEVEVVADCLLVQVCVLFRCSTVLDPKL